MTQAAIAAAGMRAFRAPGTGERWLTLAEARRLVGGSELQLRHLADTGRVRSFRTIGGHRRFLERDIRRVAANEHPDETEAPNPASAWSARLLATTAHGVIGAGGRVQALGRAHEAGAAFGATTRTEKLTLGEATAAFVDFRRRIEQLTARALRRTACSAADVEQTMSRLCDLTDEILCGIAEAYDRDAPPSAATS